MSDVPFSPLPSNPVIVQPVLVDNIAVPNPVVASASSSSGTWVQVVVETKAMGGLAVNPNIPGLPRSQRIVVRGNKNISLSESGGLKIVPRRLTAFVGRLHIDTSEEQLKRFMGDAGLVNPSCRRLANKDNKFITAAFMVSSDMSCYDLFYNESSWPEGCELRDWVFHAKVTSN